jgi:isopenicillin-N epimerase
VLRSLRLAPDDEILVLSHGYGAVRNTIRYVCERAAARVVEAQVPFPHPDPETIIANIDAALTRHTKLAVVDHITLGQRVGAAALADHRYVS